MPNRKARNDTPQTKEVRRAMRAAVGALLVILCVGCASSAPGPSSVEENTITVAIPFDIALVRTMSVLATQVPAAQRADSTDVFITTKRATMRLNEAQADCGTTEEGKPYVTDSRTVTEVEYSVDLRHDGDHTRITVTAEIEGHAKATGTDAPSVALLCASRGALERDVLNKIRQDAPIRWNTPRSRRLF